jgi:hypothetical protein
MIIDLFMVYQFIRRLATPFNEWEAYKLGIIDERGKILKKRKDLLLVKERNAFGIFDLMILKLKRLLEKIPGGQTRIASYAAALWLIREWNHFSSDSLLTESTSDEQIEESVTMFFSVITDYINETNTVNKKMHEFQENVPTMNVGSGAIAGLGVGPQGEPGLTPTQMKRHHSRAKKTTRKRLRDVIGSTLEGN